jgi:hypothetical protein
MTDYQSVTKNTQRSLPNDRAIPVVVTEFSSSKFRIWKYR